MTPRVGALFKFVTTVYQIMQQSARCCRPTSQSEVQRAVSAIVADQGRDLMPFQRQVHVIMPSCLPSQSASRRCAPPPAARRRGTTHPARSPAARRCDLRQGREPTAHQLVQAAGRLQFPEFARTGDPGTRGRGPLQWKPRPGGGLRGAPLRRSGGDRDPPRRPTDQGRTNPRAGRRGGAL